MPNDCASFDQAGNPKSPASMPGRPLGDKSGSSRRDKDWAARQPGNIKSGPTNPAILTTYEGMHHDAVSSTTATIVLAWSKATRDRLKSFRFMGRSIGGSIQQRWVPQPSSPPHSICLEVRFSNPSILKAGHLPCHLISTASSVVATNSTPRAARSRVSGFVQWPEAAVG